ncbi:MULTISPECIES: restriction endonuclease subunit S [unclassified Pseudoalteromonas]|uniref:restriction endonuclease subunit S n=1 Tax=unclassified Pseudoalteromonas TaxID=194690 RepID=UPI0025B5B5D9|nr:MULTISPECIES: restriction endonuclease subunit S [unclassified Pseudoalteromonas]MDN3396806.1 restriction endonuclease subunit S [Pseudoalteromonas sp. APC 3215]MDN3472844.1 restriction endonuclease subunit S [Pseudoalteromonas sp. APC 4026]
MAGRYKAYSEYKDSGVSWLEKVPSHWDITKTAWHFVAEKGKNGQVLTNEYIGQNNGDYPVYSGQTGNNGVMGCIDTYEFDTGKEGVLFSTTVGAKAMTLNHLKGKFSLSQNCLIIQKTSPIFNTRFCFYHFQPLFSFERGLIPEHMQASFRMEDLYQYKIALPSFEEQQKIANFLDFETAKIDTLISKQEKLIELLKEKRQAVISHAVTKGLNPNAPMRDSGVEWLGEVPEYWELKKFKYLFKIRKRIAGKTGLDILSITKKGIKVKDISSGEGQLSMDYSKYQLVNAGDFAMNHMDLLTGFVDISKYNGVTSPDYRVFTLEHKYSDSDYYLRVLQMGYLDKVFYPLGQGAANIGRWRLPTEAFNEFLAPCPPYKEQEQISSFINKTHDKIDALLEKAESAINLMKERKIGLISAAVTGKVDVRDWQPQGIQG